METSFSQSDNNRICTFPTYYGLDNYGDFVCSDFKTSQMINNSQIEFDVVRIGSLFFIIFSITIIIIKKILSSNSNKSKLKRKGWTVNQKNKIRIRQNGRCVSCHGIPPRWEYHHIDGNRNNNDLDNCQGICPNCHSSKTYDND